MADKERFLTLLVAENDKSPFEHWFKRLKDKQVRRSILVKLTRLQNPEFVNFKSVGKGVHELRIFLGPGYRIYFSFDGPEIVVLIAGGDKDSQISDIKEAQRLWKEYENEKEKHRRKFNL